MGGRSVNITSSAFVDTLMNSPSLEHKVFKTQKNFQVEWKMEETGMEIEENEIEMEEHGMEMEEN